MVRIHSTYIKDTMEDHLMVQHGSHYITYDIPVSKELSMEEFCKIVETAVNKVLENS